MDKERILEVCISTSDIEKMTKNISACLSAGAQRIELCASMECDGLTPNTTEIKAAKSAMNQSGELLIMIRPRHTNFCYDNNGLDMMCQQITDAANQQADGVVLGVLNQANHVNIDAMKRLVSCAKQQQLSVTFHRAFDAIPNQQQAIEQLATLGINRLLSNGNTWQNRYAHTPNIEKLTELTTTINGQFELVIGGGVTTKNAARLWQLAENSHTQISLHCHSAVLDQHGNIMPSTINHILS
ncbi:copper homeostasis protein CutC [Thalassotalea sp. G2M2-11]|uniref:copper homeostasis protein CutC n=1 Tax=Thalassotalea sp. G2M2-11 TaxID=2787627 RepID=UPI0019D10879|nr:copper homeostasis protein CutC [Thalassotalea sp. G2M2-11]